VPLADASRFVERRLFMEIFDLNKLLFFIFFFVPGFISMKVWRAMVPGRVIGWTDSAFEAVTYSCFNWAAMFWVFILLGKSDSTKNSLFWHYFLVFLSLFLTPVLWPITLKKLLKNRHIQKWVVLPTATAWDYFFEQKQQCWVLIHLKNGDCIGGTYFDDCYASAYPELQDIYLTEVWRVDEKGFFKDRVERTKGMWISKDAFDYLEFFD